MSRIPQNLKPFLASDIFDDFREDSIVMRYVHRQRRIAVSTTSEMCM